MNDDEIIKKMIDEGYSDDEIIQAFDEIETEAMSPVGTKAPKEEPQ